MEGKSKNETIRGKKYKIIAPLKTDTTGTKKGKERREEISSNTYKTSIPEERIKKKRKKRRKGRETKDRMKRTR